MVSVISTVIFSTLCFYRYVSYSSSVHSWDQLLELWSHSGMVKLIENIWLIRKSDATIQYICVVLLHHWWVGIFLIIKVMNDIVFRFSWETTLSSHSMAGGTLRFLASIVTAIWFHSYCFRYFPIKNFFELTFVIIITGSLPHFAFKDIVFFYFQGCAWETKSICNVTELGVSALLR